MSTAMSKVSVIRLKDGTTYTSYIACAGGNLIQYFDSTAVTPDWSDTNGHPILVFHAISSAGDGETNIVNMSLFYDGVKVISAGTYADTQGRFNLAKGSDGLWRCTIMKNLVTAGPTSNAANHTILMVGETAEGKKIQAYIGVSCSPLTDTGRRANIVSGDASVSNPFTVDQGKGTSCVLKAMLNDKGKDIDPPSGFSIQWYRQTTASGWTAISGATNQTLTVNASDVETMAVYRVKLSNSTTSEEYYDTETVLDVGDPFYLALAIYAGNTTTEASPIFTADEPGTAFRTFTPTLVNKNSGAAFAGTVSYYWKIMKPDGTFANNSSTTVGGQTIPARTTAQATLKFPAQLVDDYEGMLDVLCEAEFTV